MSVRVAAVMVVGGLVPSDELFPGVNWVVPAREIPGLDAVHMFEVVVQRLDAVLVGAVREYAERPLA